MPLEVVSTNPEKTYCVQRVTRLNGSFERYQTAPIPNPGDYSLIKVFDNLEGACDSIGADLPTKQFDDTKRFSKPRDDKRPFKEKEFKGRQHGGYR